MLLLMTPFLVLNQSNKRIFGFNSNKVLQDQSKASYLVVQLSGVGLCEWILAGCHLCHGYGLGFGHCDGAIKQKSNTRQ